MRSHHRRQARATARRALLLGAALALGLAPACGDDAPASGPTDAEAEADLGVADLLADQAIDLRDAAPDDGDAAPEVDATPEVDVTDTADVFDPTTVDGAVPVEFHPELVDEDSDRFPLGVQAGAMTSDHVLLWTNVADEATVLLRVWRPSEARGEVLLVHEERVAPAEGGFVHAPVDGLAPGTEYRYGFFATGVDDSFLARSRLGRVRTAPAPGSRPVVTLGATSCTARRFQPWHVLEALAEQPLDLFVHTGDMSYNDGAETLEEYRAEWYETLSDPGYLALYASTGLYATWDDHEVGNNFDPETIDPEQLAAARQAWFEALAVEPGPNGQIWRTYAWGDSVEVFVLDSRSERRPSTRNDDDATYLSRAQMDWLKAGLRDSTAHFKVLVNSVPITNMPWLWDVSDEDRWEGYAAQREELLDWIVDEAIANVWFLSGDFHIGLVSHVEPDGPGYDLYEIAVGPGGNGPNPLVYTLLGNDQFPFVTTELELAQVLTFDPDDDSVRVQVIQAGGVVLWDEVLRQ